MTYSMCLLITAVVENTQGIILSFDRCPKQSWVRELYFWIHPLMCGVESLPTLLDTTVILQNLNEV